MLDDTSATFLYTQHLGTGKDLATKNFKEYQGYSDLAKFMKRIYKKHTPKKADQTQFQRIMCDHDALISKPVRSIMHYRTMMSNFIAHEDSVNKDNLEIYSAAYYRLHSLAQEADCISLNQEELFKVNVVGNQLLQCPVCINGK